MLARRQQVQLGLRGHRVDWADLPGGHRGVGHPGLRGLSLQEQLQLLGVLQHSNTALYEKPGDLSAEIKPDFSGGFSSNKAEVGTVSVRLDLMVRIRAAVMKLMINSNYNKTEI